MFGVRNYAAVIYMKMSTIVDFHVLQHGGKFWCYIYENVYWLQQPGKQFTLKNHTSDIKHHKSDIKNLHNPLKITIFVIDERDIAK